MKNVIIISLCVVFAAMLCLPLLTVAQETGRLALDVSPEPAEVFINGKKYAEGSGVFKLPSGDHIVEVKKDGFPSQKFKVFIGPDALITKTVSFIEPTPIPFTLEIKKDDLAGMEFVKIPAGCFQMGCGPSDKDCASNAKPRHEVCVNEFWIGRYEVTQAQWLKIMGNNPAKFQDSPSHPVEQVSWNDVQEYIKKLNWETGEFCYRLPTEAEWEYVARAGSDADYCFGNDRSKLGNYAWYNDNSAGKTHAVGQKKPNVWGLYDMHGNVWEWCEDTGQDNYNGAPIDGSAWVVSGYPSRVIRGGGFGDNAQGIRSANRIKYFATDRVYILGFRLVRTN